MADLIAYLVSSPFSLGVLEKALTWSKQTAGQALGIANHFFKDCIACSGES